MILNAKVNEMSAPVRSDENTFEISQAARKVLRNGGREQVIAWDGEWLDSSWLASAMGSLEALLTGQKVVAVAARNRPLHVAATFANLASGRTTAMVPAGSRGAGLERAIRDGMGGVLIADREDWSREALARAREYNVRALASDEATGGFSILHDPGRMLACEPMSENALELLSSGTTGRPKNIGLGWQTISRAVADAGKAYAGSEANSPQVMVHPLANVSGLAYAIPPLVFGKPLVLLDRFSVEGWAKAVHRYRPSRATLPPAGVAMLLDSDVPPDWLESLALVAVGGGKLPTEQQDAFESRFGIPLLTAYGATEFAGVVANWTLDEYRARSKEKRGSSGRASSGVDLRVVAEDGSELHPGETGLLEARVARMGPDWIRTTDLARLDEEGFLYIEGRADGAINRGGFTIVPDVLAEELRQHPKVRDAAVVGMPDARLGEVPVAAVETVSGATLDTGELLEWLRTRVASYQVPVAVRVLEALPRTQTMKISLRDVSALFASDQAARERTP